MKVFLSWSGGLSEATAGALRDWLPSVLQSIEPYVSSADIEKGARWSIDIGQQLDETAFGILCVTAENAQSPWLNFEAGALSKSMDASRVSPFLIDLRPIDLVGPLAQFQATVPTRDDVRRLVQSINNACPGPIEPARIAAAVDRWWPDLERQLKVIAQSPPAAAPAKRDVSEMVEEILSITRSLQSRKWREPGPGVTIRQIPVERDETEAARQIARQQQILDRIEAILERAGGQLSFAEMHDDQMTLSASGLPVDEFERTEKLLGNVARKYGLSIELLASAPDLAHRIEKSDDGS
jgi:hypothetical protein